MHVAYLPLVAVGALCAVAHLCAVRTPSAAPGPGWRVCVVTGAVVLLFWLPPLVNVVLGSNNTSLMWKYITSPAVDLTGAADGLGLLSGQVALIAPWSGATEHLVFGAVQPERLWSLGLLGCLLVALLVALGLRDRERTALPVVALGQLAAAAYAAGHIEKPVFDYLVVWMLPLAAFCWAAVGVAGLELARVRLRPTPGARRLVIAGLATVALVQTTRTANAAAGVSPPQQDYATPVVEVLDQLRPQLRSADPIRIETVGDYFNLPSAGIIYGIGRAHPAFYTSDGAPGRKWGSSHRYIGQDVRDSFTVVITGKEDVDVAAQRCDRDPAQGRVAAWDRLSPDERREFNRLLLERFYAGGRLSGASAARVDALGRRSFAIAIYRGERVCTPRPEPVTPSPTAGAAPGAR
jgi:hypothetical protein